MANISHIDETFNHMPNRIPYQDKLTLPLVAAPMFLVSNPQLVIESCNSGIVGSFPALNQRSSDGFDDWLVQIKSGLTSVAAPYAVNLIVHNTNKRLEADLEVCIKHEVPIIITSLGAVPSLVDSVHEYGGLVYHDITNRRHAMKAAEAGVDGLILVAGGAGGHAGVVNPIALVNEIRSFWDKTILLSGCMSTGQDIASALQMGADLAYMGTRFINTTEANADDEYQQMIIDSHMDDIVYTAAVSGVHGSFLKQSLLNAGFSEEMLTLKKKIDFGKELDPEQAEKKAWKTIWSAGQGVTNIEDVLPVKKLVWRMKTEFARALDRHNRACSKYDL